MAQWRVVFRDEFPEIFKSLQASFGRCSQAAALIGLKEAYLHSVRRRDSALIRRVMQFVDWVLTKQRDDMKAVLQACFVEHIFQDMDNDEIEYVRPFLTSSLREAMRGAIGDPLQRLEKLR